MAVATDLPEVNQLRSELAMLAQLRGLLQGSLGADYRLSTRVVDQVLDEYNAALTRESGDGPAAE